MNKSVSFSSRIVSTGDNWEIMERIISCKGCGIVLAYELSIHRVGEKYKTGDPRKGKLIGTQSVKARSIRANRERLKHGGNSAKHVHDLEVVWPMATSKPQ